MIGTCGVDWTDWEDAQRAVLCFVRDGDRVLLIEKLRGLGAGKVNAPGGKLEAGETEAEAAIRETYEEVGLVVRDPMFRGRHRFAFLDGLKLDVTVFVTDSWRGDPRRSPEAIPFWCDTGEIPYERMWEDDRHWLPEVLAGRCVESHMLFAEDAMLCWEIRFDDGTSRSGRSA